MMKKMFESKRKLQLMSVTENMILKSNFEQIILPRSLFQAERMKIYYYHCFLIYFKIKYMKEQAK